jgi:hypothetical protein
VELPCYYGPVAFSEVDIDVQLVYQFSKIPA